MHNIEGEMRGFGIFLEKFTFVGCVWWGVVGEEMLIWFFLWEQKKDGLLSGLIIHIKPTRQALPKVLASRLCKFRK